VSGEGACVFCEIIGGERASSLVYEGERHVAFMDKHPLNPGHLLVCPKKHYATIFDMPPEEVGDLHTLVAKLAAAVRAATDADGMNIGQNNGDAASQIIQHVHVHIIPRHRNDSARGWPSRKEATQEELDRVAAKVREAHRRLSHPPESLAD
jgi:histidine triad (HIT) family protein